MNETEKRQLELRAANLNIIGLASGLVELSNGFGEGGGIFSTLVELRRQSAQTETRITEQANDQFERIERTLTAMNKSINKRIDLIAKTTTNNTNTPLIQKIMELENKATNLNTNVSQKLASVEQKVNSLTTPHPATTEKGPSRRVSFLDLISNFTPPTPPPKKLPPPRAVLSLTQIRRELTTEVSKTQA